MYRVLRPVSWAMDRILDATGFVGIALMIGLSLFVTMVMFSRHVPFLNLPGFFDAAMFAMIVFPFTMVAYAMRSDKHIRMDVLVDRLSNKAKAVMSIITYLVSMGFLFLFTRHAAIWCFSLLERGIPQTGIWQVPKWILVAPMVCGGILLALQIVRMMAKDVGFLVTDKSSGSISSKDWLFIGAFIIALGAGIYLFNEGNKVVATIVLMLTLLFSGMPVFLALGSVAVTGLVSIIGYQGLTQLPQIMFAKLNSFTLSCLPIFILSGLILARGKLTDDLFKFVEAWVGGVRSSLVLVTMIVGMIICSLTGSTTAATAMLATTAIPLLVQRGYRKSLSCGAVAASASGSLIPPSIAYVLYALLVEESVGELFMASIIPALIIFGMFFLYVIGLDLFSKRSLFEGGQIPTQTEEPISWKERLIATRDALPILFAPVLVLGTIYRGIFTPTEAAAALLLYSIVLTVFVKKTLNWRGLYRSCVAGALNSGVILSILAVAFVFAAVISQLRISTAMMNFAANLGLGQVGVMVFMVIVLFLLGMIMNPAAIKVTTVPIFYPMALAVGIHPIWLGVFYQINNEFATMTPPFGMDFFILKGMTDSSFGTVFRGVLPFIGIFILSLVIITIFPQTVLWLPATMR